MKKVTVILTKEQPWLPLESQENRPIVAEFDEASDTLYVRSEENGEIYEVSNSTDEGAFTLTNDTIETVVENLRVAIQAAEEYGMVYHQDGTLVTGAIIEDGQIVLTK